MWEKHLQGSILALKLYGLKKRGALLFYELRQI